MMSGLYFFNPENDMALANFTPYYKVSSGIVQMASDLAVLPAWFAPQGSWVKVDSLKCVEGFDDAGLLQGIHWTDCWLPMPLYPWGWNPTLVFQLRQAGVPEHCFPTDEGLENIRWWSGRQRCESILSRLGNMPDLCGTTSVCHTLDEVLRRLGEYDEAVLKAPWSGSGRGLVKVSAKTWTSSVEGWVSRILRVQGALMIEPLYNKVADFAMEFSADAGGQVSFAGYSFFETDSHGNYKENWLASDDAIEERLSQWVSVMLLHQVREKLLDELNHMFAGRYAGCLGVDMMVCRLEDGTLAVHPCVEINLRMNMGLAARRIFDAYVSPEVTGRYVVEHYNKDGEACLMHEEMRRCYPLVFNGHKIQAGYLSLTPVRPDTRYQAYLIIESQRGECRSK